MGQVLRERSNAITEGWFQVIIDGGFHPSHADRIREQIGELSEQAIATLLTEPFDSEQAQSVGASLAGLTDLAPERLGQIQEVLATQLFKDLPLDKETSLKPAFIRLLSGLATGYLQVTRQISLAEQERIRDVLTGELQQTQEAPQQAPDPGAQQIQERPSELAAANRKLQQQVSQHDRMEKQIQRQLQEATLLHQISTCIALAEDMVAAMLSVCAELAHFLQVPQAGFALLSPDGAAARVVADFHPEDSPSAMGAVIPVAGNPSMAHILENRVPLAVRDAQADPILAPIHEIMRQRRVASILLVPIIADGEVIGTLGFDTFEERVFSQADIDLVQHVANQAGQVLLRKRAEEALQASEEAIRALINATTDVLMLTDLDGIILEANDTAAHRFGMRPDEFVGSCIWELMPPDVTARRMERADEILQSGKPVRFEDWRSGMWFDNVVHPVRDAKGTITGFAVFARDITERRRVEEALKESESRLGSILSAMVDFVFALDREGRFIFYHAPPIEDPYVLPHELLGKPFPEVTPAHVCEPIMEALRKNREGQVADFEYWLELNGIVRWFFAKLSPVFMDGDYHGSVAVSREITEWKRTEQALLASEEKIRALLNAPDDVVMLVDIHGTILEANDAAARRFSMRVDEFVGSNIWDLLPAELVKFRKAHVDRVFETGSPIRLEDERAGVWFDNNVSPVSNAQGEIVSVALLARDITQRKQMEEQLRRSLEETERGQQMLLALSQATQAVQRARTPEEIYRTIGEGIASLGYDAAVFTLSADQAQLIPAYMTYDPDDLQVAEEITGFSTQNDRLPVVPDGLVEQVLAMKAAVYSAEPASYMSQVLPTAVGPPIEQVTSSMGIERIIHAPLVVGDEIHGLLVVTGSDLREADTQAMSVFASQTAIALANTQLFQEIRTWAAELEGRVAERTRELASANVELEAALAERKKAEEAIRRSREETLRSHRLLLALSQAAETVQRAHTPEEVFQMIGDQVASLGYRIIVFALTNDQTQLFLSHLTIQLTTHQAAEQLSSGLTTQGLQLPLAIDSPFRRVITENRSLLLEHTGNRLASYLPELGQELQDRLAAILGNGKSIYAPLSINGRKHGLLAVTGNDLTEADVPTVTLFANRAAIAIENARLVAQLTTGRLQLQRLARQVVSAQEEERQRLSRALHDEAGQALTALKISLNLIGEDLPEAETLLRQRISDAASLTDTTMERIRLLAQDLRPPALDAVGLNHTLDGLCQDFGERTQLAIDYHGQELPKLPGLINIVLYRFVQEALTNVAKHAGARHVSVVLQHDTENVHLSVKDDGRGFSPQSEAPTLGWSKGMGILGMQERIEWLGGKLEVESQPGSGARLVAHIPLLEA